MGMFHSKRSLAALPPSTQTSASPLPVAESLIVDNPRDFQPQYHTLKDLEMEVDKIYQRSHRVLQSLTHNPCDQSARNITDCLARNAQQMAACFAEMSSYQECVIVEQQQKHEQRQHNGGAGAGQTLDALM